MRSRRLLPAAVLLLAAECPTECAGPSDTSTYIIAIRVAGGDQQVGPAGTTLPVPLSVQLFDAGSGRGAAGANSNVWFSIEAGGGRLGFAPGFGGGLDQPVGSVRVVTDAAGFAAVSLTMGPQPGEIRVTATFGDRTRFERFTVRGHGPATTVTLVSGDGQSGEAGADLSARPTVKVTDATGTGVPGLRVWFYPNDGGFPLDGEVVTTDQFGASMRSQWRLGPLVGVQTLDARVLQGPTGVSLAALAGNPVRFTATARAPTATSVRRNPTTFPEPQTGVAGRAVDVKPSVRVDDAGGRPVPGVSVRFAVTAGNGTLGGVLVQHERPTDAAGIATVPDWILGAPGTNIVTATVQAPNVAGSPVIFTAVAREPAPASVLRNPAAFPEPQSGIAGQAVGLKPSVRVLDDAGHPVANVAIRYAITAGGGTLGGALTQVDRPTDAGGVATVPDWILGGSGTNTVSATVLAANVAGSPVIFTAIAAARLTLAITAGNGQTVPINTVVPIRPTVRVTDATGAGVAGIRIQWTLAGGSGVFTPSTIDTDAEGYASVAYFGPTAVGTASLRASTTDPRINPASVTFTITGTPGT